ncbi:MAG TPA: ribosome-associated translation inhibitor RaiA [Ignavibacteria bacterium]|jgi:ribosomal subunit interface protein
MTLIFTARHFKAHDTLKEFAEEELQKLSKFYDGIIKSEVILSYDKPTNSIKTAEVIVHANNHHTFTAKDSSDDFKVSIEGAVDKITTQIRKYKDRVKDIKATAKVVEQLKKAE